MIDLNNFSRTYINLCKKQTGIPTLRTSYAIYQQHPTLQKPMPSMNNSNLLSLMNICNTFHLVKTGFQICLKLIMVMLVLSNNYRKLFLIVNGPDKVPVIFLNETVIGCGTMLHHMFCQSYQNGTQPSNWTCVLVCLIYKKARNLSQ